MNVRLPDPDRSRILLIGTPFHVHTDEHLPDVPVVANNLTDLASVFIDPELGGFNANRCVIAPTNADLGELGDRLIEAAEQAEDLLLIYFAGHGVTDTRGQLYLALAGTRWDRLAFTALPYETVRGVCLDSNARSRVVIVDSCFSGRAIGSEMAAAEQKLANQLEVAGTYILTSAHANGTALFLQGERHTAFTGRLLDLLRDGDPNAGPVLSLGEIYHRLRSRFMAEGLPIPQRRGTASADLLGLVRNRQVSLNLADQVPGQRLLAEVERLANSITNPNEKVSALSRLVALVARTDPTESRRIAAEAEQLANRIAGKLPKVHALAEIAMALAHTDPTESRRIAAEAEQLANTIRGLQQRTAALAETAAALAHTDPSEARRIAAEAEQLASRISGTQSKVNALAELAPALAHTDPALSGRIATEAERLAKTIIDPSNQVSALMEVAAALANTDAAEAKRLATEAERLAKTIIDPSKQVSALMEVAAALANTDAAKAKRLATEAEQTAATCRYLQETAAALEEIAAVVAVIDPTQAERIARKVPYASAKTRALIRVLTVVADTNPAKARRIANKITDDAYRQHALNLVAAAAKKQKLSESIDAVSASSRRASLPTR